MGSSMPIGDILELSQTAWNIGHDFAHEQTKAPQEFAEVERVCASSSNALKSLASILLEDISLRNRDEAQKLALMKQALALCRAV